MRTRQLVLAGLALLAVPFRLAAAPAPTATAPLVPGARGIALTVLEGDRIVELPLTYLGTYDDFVGPGYDLHLVRLEGPTAELVGIAAGMSGSPVYIDGRLIGALSYRLGTLPREAVAGVTPIEQMLEAGGSQGPGHRAVPGPGVTPIATPVIATGLHPLAREWLTPQLAELGFVATAGGTAGTETAEIPELVPGSPVGVELMRGDLSIAATGTVTWVDGDWIYAFGHPFFGTGRVELPMVAARVLHTLSDLAGSAKLAEVGPQLGAIVEDRLTAVVGRRGATARRIPMRLTVRGGDYGEQVFRYEMVPNAQVAPLLAGLALANSLLANSGYSERATMVARGRVGLRDMADLPIEMAYSGDAASNPGLRMAAGLQQTLQRLLGNPFAEIAVEELSIDVQVSTEEMRYRLDDVHYDRRPVHAGQTLEVQCVVQRFRGGTQTRTLTLVLPDHLPEGGSLMLALGSQDSLERALGQPLRQRLQSATGIDAYVRALGDQHAAHRLTAMIYEPGRAVINRGLAYTGLPPTIEWMLREPAAPQTSAARPREVVSPLALTELLLDGPVEGVLQVRLRVDEGRAQEDRR